MKRNIGLFLLIFFLASSVLSSVSFALTEGQLIEGLAAFRAMGMTDPNQLFLAERLEKGLVFYDGLRDYSATFYKTETEEGKLNDTEEIFLKFEKPFKIFMGWRNTAKKGLQVLYERGKHKGNLAIHKPGVFLGLAPVLFLAPSSPWVRQGSASYNIEDAGIGTFLHDLAKAVVRAVKEKKLLVKKNGDTLEVTFVDSQKNEDYFAHRIRVAFELNGLPVEMELYDWQDQLIGKYAYRDLKLNVGSGDEAFKREIDRHLYQVYSGN